MICAQDAIALPCIFTVRAGKASLADIKSYILLSLRYAGGTSSLHMPLFVTDWVIVAQIVYVRRRQLAVWHPDYIALPKTDNGSSMDTEDDDDAMLDAVGEQLDSDVCGCVLRYNICHGVLIISVS